MPSIRKKIYISCEKIEKNLNVYHNYVQNSGRIIESQNFKIQLQIIKLYIFDFIYVFYICEEREIRCVDNNREARNQSSFLSLKKKMTLSKIKCYNSMIEINIEDCFCWI